MKYLFLLLLTACSNMPRATDADPQHAVLGLVGQKQEQSLWCAAASARMLMSQKTKNLPSQCQIVSRVTGKPCVNQTIDAKDALTMFGYKVTELPITFFSATHSINSDKPVIIYRFNRAGTTDGSAHAIVAYATFQHGGKDYLITYDPFTDRWETIDESYVKGNLAWFKLIRIE